MNLVADPETCERIIRWLTDVSAAAGHALCGDGRVGVDDASIVGECAACMLDVDNFRRFVVPATSALGGPFRQGAISLVRPQRPPDRGLPSDPGTGLAGRGRRDVGGRIRAVFGRAFPMGIAPVVEDMKAAFDGGHPAVVSARAGRERRRRSDDRVSSGVRLQPAKRSSAARGRARVVARVSGRSGCVVLCWLTAATASTCPPSATDWSMARHSSWVW